MNDASNVVAVYNSHTEAEQAVAKLSAASFDITKISIIGKDYHTEENVVGYYSTGDSMKFWGLFYGAGFFLVPGICPVLVAGPFLAALLGALESAVVVGGLSAVAAGLVSLGVSKDRAVKYEAQIKADKFVLIVHGTAEELERARTILAGTSPISIEKHEVAA